MIETICEYALYMYTCKKWAKEIWEGASMSAKIT